MRDILQAFAMALTDVVMSAYPRRIPTQAALANCRIVSHRGEHDNRAVMENTLQAFIDARSAGVWGIECDVRWTADDVPVICHDTDAERVFGEAVTVAEVPFDELRAQLPEIPSLEELVREFGGNTHLMLELKEHGSQRRGARSEILEQHLAGLVPGEHFHFLALDVELFQEAEFVEPRYCLPVAETNVAKLSELSLTRGYAGISGHYLLLGQALQRRHRERGQCLGTGFPNSKNALFRELNRGVDWVFSNNAVQLQIIRDQHLR